VAGTSKGGRRIDNPPDPEGTPKNLPHDSSRRAKNVMDSSTLVRTGLRFWWGRRFRLPADFSQLPIAHPALSTS